ncbi:MAG: hypothetical protein NNA21_04630 [Nitrospira sp.]|nr:hypothetical protein [Nitrospira sp.]MCP9461517.1 hypothetical protein [Nitrospira sp.]MCP9473969.1 hypothetical protein [Nitrospira sp.]
MKLSLIACFVAAGWLVGPLLALANPAMLPKHPGYPMGKAVDPVNGQLLANDPGQKNATVQEALVDSARANESHSKQNLLINEENRRIIEKPGAGLLPKVEGPNIKIEPPVKEGMRVTASPQ